MPLETLNEGVRNEGKGKAEGGAGEEGETVIVVAFCLDGGTSMGPLYPEKAPLPIGKRQTDGNFDFGGPLPAVYPRGGCHHEPLPDGRATPRSLAAATED